VFRQADARSSPPGGLIQDTGADKQPGLGRHLRHFFARLQP